LERTAVIDERLCYNNDTEKNKMLVKTNREQLLALRVPVFNDFSLQLFYLPFLTEGALKVCPKAIILLTNVV